MSPILRLGVSVVFVALACYTAGVVAVRRDGAVSRRGMRFLLAGVVFDIVATVFMIIGSGRVITLHGVIGYSALSAMLVDTWFAWQHRRRFHDGPAPRWLQRYTWAAYAWWIVAFVTGSVLAVMSRTAGA